MTTKPFALAGIFLAGMALSGSSISRVADQVRPPAQALGLDAHQKSASASLLGQFRTSVSSWLWVRTDLYLHNGVEMRPLTQLERDHGEDPSSRHDAHECSLHNDQEITTVIPPAEHDFRGIFGDLERATKAYRNMDGHEHRDPKCSLPLFRLMTWIDPQFVQAWTTGASVMAWGNTSADVDHSLAFLRQGLAHNPQSIAILKETGVLLASKKHQLPEAVECLEQARRIGRTKQERIDEDENEALLECYRWLALLYRELGELDKTYATSSEGLEVFPGDAVLERLRHPRPTPLVHAR